MLRKEKGLSLYELLIVLMLISMMAAWCLPSFTSFYHREKTQALKTILRNALSLAKKEALLTRDTIAFCLGHGTECFQQPITSALIYTDTFHDALLHDKTQIRSVIALPPINGTLLLRSFPRYRHAIVFKTNDGIDSDNGSIWFCEQKDTHPQWGISINRAAMIHDLTPNAKGDITDAKGQLLRC